MVVALICLVLLASNSQTALGSEVPGSEVPGTGFGGFAVYAGGVAADLGGDSSAGVALGIKGRRRPVCSRFHFQFGLEFSDKRNSGDVRSYNSGDGSLVYEGRGTVSLKYLQVFAEIQYVQPVSSVDLVPYMGVSPALVVNQSVSTSEPPDAEFGSFDWYNRYDVLALFGVELCYRRVLLDFQVARGLLDLKSGKVRNPGDWTGAPLFTTSDGRSRSYRVAAGVSF